MAETALRLFHKKLDIGNRLVRVEPGKGHLLLAANPSGQPPDPGQAVNALAAAGLTGLVDVYTGSQVQQQDFGGLPCIVVQFPTVARCKHIFQTLRFIRSQPRGAVVQTMGYLYRMA